MAAIGAVLAAIVIVAVLLFRGGGSYEVQAQFLNAGQLVKGNNVQIAGTKVGSVKKLEITDEGQALVTLQIEEDYAPLRTGTQAVIRQASQSGIANRYVDLQLPPGDERTTGTIDDGSRIPIDKTTTAVELDELFNTLNPKTRTSIREFFKNSAKFWAGKEEEQRIAYRYLNPALNTSSRLFNELNRDQPLLERFLVDSAELVTTLAERRDDLTNFITNANTTFQALRNEKAALAESIGLLPDFMRQSNTTFVNLRAALEDVDPLVEASRPVARELRPFLNELRPLVRDARPTIRDLSRIVFQPGKDNDLYNLINTFPPLASAALDRKQRSIDFGGGRQDLGVTDGAFQTMERGLRDASPIIAFGRPYTPDFVGWLEDFSTTGGYDAMGGFSRSQTIFNAVDATSQIPGIIPLSRRFENLTQTIHTDQFRRCPGGGDFPAPDRSNVLSAEEQAALDCTEEHRAPYGAPSP